ncbi:MAG: hypothetical protein IPK03_14510 [Bacteroidetes bacterium]|nr:hypothetical protein [Bacteroidota bacterium]
MKILYAVQGTGMDILPEPLNYSLSSIERGREYTSSVANKLKSICLLSQI